MAKTHYSKSKPSKEIDDTQLQLLLSHYTQWDEDINQRLERKNGWNDITDAYWGKLPSDWPYLSRIILPVIRTTLLEKNARLLNSKLRGRLVPRDGGDVLKARLQNALLDYQWDSALKGGTMLGKWGNMDMDTRLYGSKFALVKWRYDKDDDGKTIFNGNEFQPLDIRDCGIDPQAIHIRDARWFQHGEWVRIEDLYKEGDTSDGENKYINLDVLVDCFSNDPKAGNYSSDRRDNKRTSRILENKGLTDRVGEDKSYPVVYLVTEYTEDRWIKFSPKYKVIIQDIENPYKHKKIPVIQLRYYDSTDDPLGESEVESVLPIFKGIQATVCGYMDNMNMHVRPPLKIIDGAARIETIIWAPEAPWIVDRQDAVEEMRGNGEAMRYFQVTLQALLSAFNTAMGDTSMGVSAFDPNEQKKTATEIKQSTQQQLTRDQKNQQVLSDALQDMMSMWMSNNQQFLFADEGMHEYVLRIVGSELFNYFKRAGLDEMELPVESVAAIGDIIDAQGGNVSDDDINTYVEAGKVPRFPVATNPEEQDVEKIEYTTKMRVNDMGDGAELTLVPEDLQGTYDYIPSVKSMSQGAEEELISGRQRALEQLTNPAIQTMLQSEGVRPRIKDILTAIFEDTGMKDADRLFEQISEQEAPMDGMPQANPLPQVPPEVANMITQDGEQQMQMPQGMGQMGM